MLIFGLHPVEALMRRHPERIVRVLRDPSRDDARTRAIDRRIEPLGLTVRWCRAVELDGLTGGASHQGVAAEVRPFTVQGESALGPFLERLDSEPLLLVLDGVQDPGNLGACLRSADAAGVDAVVVPKDRACPINATVHKAASGAAGLVPVFRVTNLVRSLRGLQQAGVWLVGAAVDAPQAIQQARLAGPLGLVLGGEADGLRRLTRKCCDLLVRIPMHGSVASLNVSVAVGICLYEVRRQRDRLK